MSYSIYLFKSETRKQYPTTDQLGEALELGEEKFSKFTQADKERLQKRLKAYKYVEVANSEVIEYEFKNASSGITASLYPFFLVFKAPMTQNGIAEIAMTSSEFCDSDFDSFDFQEGNWAETY